MCRTTGKTMSAVACGPIAAFAILIATASAPAWCHVIVYPTSDPDVHIANVKAGRDTSRTVSPKAARAPAQAFAIRLYDYTNLPVNTIVRAEEVTDVVLGHAGVRVAWVQCRGGAGQARSDAACERGMRTNEITVRLISREPKGGHAQIIMAHTLIGQRPGQYVTVYMPAVRVIAEELNLSLDVLLGHVIAHESGHCLLGPAHSATGLMRARWTREDARDMARLSLGLAPQQARKTAAAVGGGSRQRCWCSGARR